MLQPFGQLVPKAINRAGIGKQLEASTAVGVAEEFFSNYLGNQIDQVRVVSFKAGILTIECLNSVVANEVAQSELRLGKYLKKKVPRAQLKSIRTRLTHEFEAW